MRLWQNSWIVVKNNMSSQKFFILVIGILVVGVFAIIIYRSNTESIVKNYDTFAQCLATKNMTMYGAEWCSHCKSQKALFGESFKFMLYVECADFSVSPNICLEKGIEGYPTWIDENGVKYVGEQSLEKLSKITGCEL